jgi:hypothetical protein
MRGRSLYLELQTFEAVPNRRPQSGDRIEPELQNALIAG